MRPTARRVRTAFDRYPSVYSPYAPGSRLALHAVQVEGRLVRGRLPSGEPMAISKHHPHRLAAPHSLRAGARRTWLAALNSVRHPIQSGLARLLLVAGLLVALYA